MRLTLVPETTVVPREAHQLTLLDALDAATPPDPGARPPTPAMLRVLALAAVHPSGEVLPGSLNPGAFSALCAALIARGLARLECGGVVISYKGRRVVLAAEGRN